MSIKPKIKALLALENGIVFEGYSFGARTERGGELVFNTAMTGYQEVITDPSYKGQMIVMTYPHIGNYGINSQDNESDKVHLEALIVKDYCDTPSNFRSEKTLGQFLEEFNVPGISGIDTRKLTRILRTEGCFRAVLSTEDLDPKRLVAKAKTLPSMEGQDLASQVTTKNIYVAACEHVTPPLEFTPIKTAAEDGLAWCGASRQAVRAHEAHPPAGADDAVSNGGMFQRRRLTRYSSATYHVVAIDLGIKRNILRKLSHVGCKVTVVPSHTSAKDILNLNPDGIFLSNGPGDPAAVTTTIQTAKELIGQKPIFGICLGHQILGLALGGKTSKLKFGHHGANHPILNTKTKSIEITSQNHNFYVDKDSLKDKVDITHINLNDQTLEGFSDPKQKILSVQYHPEAAPGPHDSHYLFNEFLKMMEIPRPSGSE